MTSHPSATDLNTHPIWPSTASGERTPNGDSAPPIINAVREAVLGTGSRGLDLIIVIDGLGFHAAERYRSYTPHLRQLSAHTRPVRTLAPSTTATVLTSLLTGCSPLEHGVLGYTVFTDADGTRTVPQLSGDPSIDPAEWMPLQNLGQQAIASGRSATQVGPVRYAKSFLSMVMQRDWAFVQQRSVNDRVRAVESALHRARGNGVVYLHLAELDKAGHHAGPGSDAWLAALEDVDQLVGTLVRRLSDQVRLTITADHGMVPTSRSHIVDLADSPIGTSITGVAGEPRALSIRSDIAHPELVEQLQQAVGERALVMGRAELLASGLLGHAASLTHHAQDRLGDAIMWARGNWALTHSDFIPDAVLGQRGMHGSLTDEEMLVPLIRVGA